jgi:hypothetical protein
MSSAVTGAPRRPSRRRSALGFRCVAFVVCFLATVQDTRGEEVPVDLDFDLDDPTLIDSDARKEARLGELPQRENGVFYPGERLTFSVRYGIVRAGECRLEVLPNTTVDGRDCHHLIGTAVSSDGFNAVFRVNDRMESMIDAQVLLPWRFEKELHEGQYDAIQRIEFDQLNRVATYHDGTRVSLTEPAFDVLSALYVIRTMPLSPGTRSSLPIHADKKNVPLEIHVRGRERVETPAGTFDCLEVEPLIVLDSGLYDHKRGKLVIYVTDDERRLPVMFKVKVFFGSIVLTLTEHHEGEEARG